MTRAAPSAWPRPNLALVGFMGAGKTTLGRLLADCHGCPFIDLDEMIERHMGLSIPEIFQGPGEAAFRRVEGELLQSACSGEGAVISCGGGTVLAAENRRILRTRCLSIWLRASAETLLGRLIRPESPKRPLLPETEPGETVRRMLAVREPLYRHADITVDTEGMAPEQAVVEILRAIEELD
ncbi:MAG: shikimate kinase [Candidatus Eisenbacteria bacterium]|nr:shikimate kinase [Candidatus Eisenbacteria bacterium]